MATYTRTTTLVLAILLILVFSTAPLHAQQRGGGRRGGPPQGTGAGAGPPRLMLPPEYDNRPFDTRLAQLPPQYLGSDAELAYTRIRNGIESNKRGEIATISKNQEKPGQGPRLPVPPSLNLESTYAFRINPERFYDAPSHTLKVYCPFSTVLENGKEDASRKGLRVKYQPRVDNRHVGTNASGAKVEFEELKFREYLIAFANFEEFPVERVVLPEAQATSAKEKKTIVSVNENLKKETIIGNINATPPEAQELQERIAVLVVCKLIDPYITSDRVEQKPTPDKPRDYLAEYYYLNVRVLELWFYNFDTGKILLKLTAEKK